MTEDSGKKGFFARINEALYETVEQGGKEETPEAETAGGGGQAPDVAAPTDDQLAGSPTDLAARVRATIASRGQALTQFLVLASSFAEIIPEESGRYRAAMKALEKTGSITREEVLRATENQLSALGAQRTAFAGAVNRKRGELKKSGGGAEEIRARIAELQQTIGRLQAEEQEILRNVAVEEGKIKAAEEGFTALLAAMESEIKESREKIEKHVPGGGQ